MRLPMSEAFRVPEQRGDRLLEAMDAFVLAGALKKYRTAKSGIRFKHHTMLVHHSQLKGQHEVLVDRIRALGSRRI